MTSIERPWIKFSEALEIATIIHENKIENVENLALKLGHKTSKSGGFNMKLSSLAKYRLADRERGKIRLTPLAQRILMPIGDLEKFDACREAILSIPLLKRLNDRLGGAEIREDELWTHLYEISNDREASMQEAGAVYRIYRDALIYLRKASELVPSEKRPVTHDQRSFDLQDRQPMGKPRVNEELIRFESGDVVIQLPRTAESLDVLSKFLATLKVDRPRSEERHDKEEPGETINQ